MLTIGQTASAHRPIHSEKPRPVPIEITALHGREGTAQASEPFEVHAIIPADNGFRRKWNTIEQQFVRDRAILMQCLVMPVDCPRPARKLQAIVAKGRSRRGLARIGTINRAVNMAIQPTSDMAQFGVPDVWSGPLSTLGSGRGDCEDYATVKLFALMEAGLPTSDLRLVILKEIALNQGHAVAAVRFRGRWLILNNNDLALVTPSAMREFIPSVILWVGKLDYPVASNCDRRHGCPSSH